LNERKKIRDGWVVIETIGKVKKTGLVEIKGIIGVLKE